MQPRFRRTISTLGALALTLLLARAAQAGPFVQPADDLAAQASAMLERVNQARQQAGLAPYAVNPALAQAAQGHAEEIAEFAHYSHTSRDGRKAKDRVLQAGYAAGREGLRVGENFVGRSNIDDAFGWLMSDPPHRANIVDPDYREIGVGVGKISYGYIWVMDLGTYTGIEDALAAPPAAAETPVPSETPAPPPSETPLPVTALPAPFTEAPPAATASVTVPVISTLAPATATPESPAPEPDADGQGEAPGGRLLLLALVLLLVAAALGYALFGKRRQED